MTAPKILTQGEVLKDTSSVFNLVLGLGWSSDWNGEEVGYPEVEVVGPYTWGALNVYIDIESQSVLEIWSDDVEDDVYEDSLLYSLDDRHE